MDLSVAHYIEPYDQYYSDAKNLSVQMAAVDAKYQAITAKFEKAWSHDKALDLAEVLKKLDESDGAALQQLFSRWIQNGSEPPAIRPIDPPPATPKALLADASAYVINSSYSDSNLYVSSGVMLVAQAQTTASDSILTTCARMEPGDTDLGPLSLLKHYFRSNNKSVPMYIPDAVVSVVQQPKYGKVVGVIDKEYGETYFKYVANDPSWMGKDRVDFLVNYQGKTYKIINRIEMVDNLTLYRSPEDDKACDIKLRRIAYEASVHTADGSGSDLGFDADAVHTLLDNAASQIDLSNVMLVFGNLPQGAVGETTGEGSNAPITLDADAAGHGW